MSTQRIGISAAFAALFAVGLVALPLSAAKAQYYGPPCTPFPLTWPFCVAGAVVGTAATIATAPFRAAAGPFRAAAGPYYGYGYGYYPPPYYPPRYYGRPYYYGR
jgi:hypothetical protein